MLKQFSPTSEVEVCPCGTIATHYVWASHKGVVGLQRPMTPCDDHLSLAQEHYSAPITLAITKIKALEGRTAAFNKKEN